MSDSLHSYDQPDPDLAELESMVRNAGRYIQPTYDLRPNAMEATREAWQQRRRDRRMSGLTFLMVLLVVTGLPSWLLKPRPSFAVMHSEDLHRRASQSAVERGIGTNWALYEVFSELRADQAEMLNHSN